MKLINNIKFPSNFPIHFNLCWIKSGVFDNLAKIKYQPQVSEWRLSKNQFNLTSKEIVKIDGERSQVENFSVLWSDFGLVLDPA